MARKVPPQGLGMWRRGVWCGQAVEGPHASHDRRPSGGVLPLGHGIFTEGGKSSAVGRCRA